MSENAKKCHGRSPAAGVLLPNPFPPPMNTNCSTPSKSSGCAEMNTAMFVIGPHETIVTLRPAPPFQVSLTAFVMPCRAEMGFPSSLRARRAWTSGLSGEESPTTAPSPSLPCISGQCFATLFNNGFAAPGYTLICAGAANAWRHLAALIAVQRTVVFPWTCWHRYLLGDGVRRAGGLTVETPRRFILSRWIANKIAVASS